MAETKFFVWAVVTDECLVFSSCFCWQTDDLRKGSYLHTGTHLTSAFHLTFSKKLHGIPANATHLFQLQGSPRPLAPTVTSLPLSALHSRTGKHLVCSFHLLNRPALKPVGLESTISWLYPALITLVKDLSTSRNPTRNLNMRHLALGFLNHCRVNTTHQDMAQREEDIDHPHPSIIPLFFSPIQQPMGSYVGRQAGTLLFTE